MEKSLACCYTRFSTDNQNQSSTIGQLRAIKAYCDKNNIELIDTYIDEAQSGTNMNRTNFQRMLADAPTAAWDTVVVYNMSRLSRSVKDALQIKDDFRRMGKRILSVIENQEETPEGDFFNLITYGLNELFVKQFKRDSWRGLMVNAKDAKALGGIPPYGFCVNKDRKYAIDEEEAEVVRTIFKMVIKGFSYRDIATYLNKKGYTKRGRPWNHSLTDILRNEKYRGIYTWNKREGKARLEKKTNRVMKPEDQIVRIPGGCPQIVDDRTFDRVQEILNGRTRQYSHKGPKSRYLLSGMLVCGYCGSAYTGTIHFSGRNRLRRDLYECGGRKRLHKCRGKDINMTFLDEYITDLIAKVILPEANAPIYKEEVNKSLDRRRRIISDRLAALAQSRKELQEEAARYGKQLSEANEDEYIEITRLIGENAQRRTELEAEQSKLKAMVLEYPRLTVESVSTMLSAQRKKWKTGTKQNRPCKEVLSDIIAEITITNETITVKIDLKSLLYGMDGRGESSWILEIPEDREAIAKGYRNGSVDLSSKKLSDAFRRKSNSHAE